MLRKHKAMKRLVAEALDDNKLTRSLLAELERTPKESEEFADKVAELRRTFQQHVRDEKQELLPAVLKALSDEEVRKSSIALKMRRLRSRRPNARKPMSAASLPARSESRSRTCANPPRASLRQFASRRSCLNERRKRRRRR